MIALLQKATFLFYMGYKNLCNVAYLVDSFYEIRSMPSSREFRGSVFLWVMTGGA
jgi:hypothetical protein